LQYVAKKPYLLTKVLTMKLKFFIVLAVFCISTLPKLAHTNKTFINTEASPLDEDENEFDESLIKVRLRKLNSAIDIRYTPEVKKFLQTYVKSYRTTSEHLLGRATMYFPFFDQALNKYNLPVELKMISVIESSLNPNAISPAGAIGLWQFMPGTARDMGLNFNSVVDERRDPNKSAEAAARFLARLYDQFGDWGLALAAYNCGPNRVLNAIKSAGGEKDFWTIRKYLPRETQNYVPKFIAINYIFNYYTKHKLKPTFPELDLQITEISSLYSKVDLRALSNRLNVPYEVMKALNPMYRQGYIPASENAMNIILPLRSMNNFRNTQPALDKSSHPLNEMILTSNTSDDSEYVELVYTVSKGERLEDIAVNARVSNSLIKFWNGMSNNSIKEGQTLKLYAFKNQQVGLLIKQTVVQPLSEQFVQVKSMMEDGNFINTSLANVSDDEEVVEYIMHRLGEKESIADVADQYNDVTIENIIDYNKITKDNLPMPGDMIRVKIKAKISK